MFNSNLNVIKGGLIIPNPYPLATLDLRQAPLPAKVVLSLQQRASPPAIPCVKVGDRVLTGQVITHKDAFCVPIHASISGVVVNIGEENIPHKSGLKSLSISIKSDNKDEWIKPRKKMQDFYNYSSATLIQRIHNSGIVGLGGAGFPTHIKIAKTQNCHSLIINGTECEPGIMCDDALMQHYPQQVLKGVEILLHICGAKKAIIAIEDNKPKSLNTLLKLNKNSKISIQAIPTKYTSGAEKLLIKALLNIEIPSGSFSVDKGIICQNVATTKAIFDAVIEHKPLISRIITVTGSGIDKPGNFEVRLGASFSHLINLSKPNANPHSLRQNGMMMGVNIQHDKLPIGKTSNCIFVNNTPEKPQQQPCIRCGQCNTVCPVGLLPQQLYWYAKSEEIEKANDYNLRDCIECACCDFVCPSHIPLADYFSFAKALQRKQTLEKEQADVARQRFEYREYRLQRNKIEREKMLAAKKKALQEKMAKEQTQKQQIADAMTRVKQRKTKAKQR